MNEFMIQPHNKLSEDFILGCCLQDNASANFSVEKLHDNCFYDNTNNQIFSVIKDLVKENIAIDTLVVHDRIVQNKFPIDPVLLFDLVEKTASTANIEYHINEVNTKHSLRQLLVTAGEMENLALQGTISPSEILETLEEKIESLKFEKAKSNKLPDWSNVGRKRKKLKDCLIEGVLRVGHKMIISGASKAGKSFMLLGLAIDIVEGRKWLNHFKCKQGKVLYCNFEIDDASFDNRVHDVYEGFDIPKTNMDNLIIWSLRGAEASLDKISEELEERMKTINDITTIIIDPLYKILEGDENDAGAMTRFGNKLDKIATKYNMSVIYCHHHTKGKQGDKNAQDRSSGSGVLSRDPDAIIDLIELDTPEVDFNDIDLNEYSNTILALLKDDESRKILNSDILTNFNQTSQIVERYSENPQLALWELRKLVNLKRNEMNDRKAFRLESSLREFKSFTKFDVWFNYPIHKKDEMKLLADFYPKGDPRNKKVRARPKTFKPSQPRTKEFKDFIECLETNYVKRAGNVDGLVVDCFGSLTAENRSKFLGCIEKSNEYCLTGNGTIMKETVDFN